MVRGFMADHDTELLLRNLNYVTQQRDSGCKVQVGVHRSLAQPSWLSSLGPKAYTFHSSKITGPSQCPRYPSSYKDRGFRHPCVHDYIYQFTHTETSQIPKIFMAIDPSTMSIRATIMGA